MRFTTLVEFLIRNNLKCLYYYLFHYYLLTQQALLSDNFLFLLFSELFLVCFFLDGWRGCMTVWPLQNYIASCHIGSLLLWMLPAPKSMIVAPDNKRMCCCIMEPLLPHLTPSSAEMIDEFIFPIEGWLTHLFSTIYWLLLFLQNPKNNHLFCKK